MASICRVRSIKLLNSTARKTWVVIHFASGDVVIISRFNLYNKSVEDNRTRSMYRS